MSALTSFLEKQKSYNDRVETALAGLKGDVDSLVERIRLLQDSAGSVTPEDQALIDELETHGNNIATALEALDNVTPPEVPAAKEAKKED